MCCLRRNKYRCTNCEYTFSFTYGDVWSEREIQVVQQRICPNCNKYHVLEIDNDDKQEPNSSEGSIFDKIIHFISRL